MQTATIRSIDYWLGVPLCALLTALRSLLPERRMRPKRILFLKFIEQGATVLAQDAIARAARQVGRDNLYFCVFESNRAILDVLDLIPAANILCIRDRQLTTFVIDFLGALLTMRARGVDTVIDMEFFSRASAIFGILSGASTRVGLHRYTGELPYRGDLLTHRVQYNPHLHIANQYALLVEAAFLEPVDEPLLKFPFQPEAPAEFVFVPSADERQAMKARLGEGAPVIILNPNASDLLPLRKWELSKFIELGRQLLERHPGARIALTGGPGEQAAATAIAQALDGGRVTSFAGHTTMRELLTLYSLADVLVTNDSGPGHFASLTTVHAVVLFGPETPELFGSRSPNTTIIWKALACSPCVNVFNHRLSPCRNNVCMQSITVEDVFAAVQGAIERRASRAT